MRAAIYIMNDNLDGTGGRLGPCLPADDIPGS